MGKELSYKIGNQSIRVVESDPTSASAHNKIRLPIHVRTYVQTNFDAIN